MTSAHEHAADAEGRPRPIFIVGSSRSGTTMFSLMLNAHPRIHIPGETWFVADLMDQLPLRGALTPGEVELARTTILGHWRWSEWGIDDPALREAFDRLQTPSLPSLLDSVYRLPMRRASKQRWGDKTPGYATEITRLHTVFPEAQILHIIRDGRDVCLSLRKTGWRGDTTPMIAQYWQDTVAAACTAGRALPDGSYLEISYERLVLETEEVLRSVCGFLDEEFHDAMLGFHETAQEKLPDRAQGHLQKTTRPPRSTDVQRWKGEMKRRHIAVVEAFAGPALELTGYERSFTRGLGMLRATYGGLDWIARRTLPLRRKLGIHFPKMRKRL